MSDTSGTDQQEPSMEEILASIRRIIAEDGEEETDGEEGAEEAAPEEAAGEEPEPEQAAAEEPEPEPEPEPIEEPEPETAAEAAAPEEPAEDVLELTEVVEEEPAAAIGDDVEIELAEPPEEPDTPPDAPPDDGLMSDAPAEETSSAFAALASAITASTPIGGAERTIEDLLTDMLRPLLKVWLDEHLPDLVERMVRDEIGRVAQRTRGR